MCTGDAQRGLVCPGENVSLSNCVFKLPCVRGCVCTHVSFRTGMGGWIRFLGLPYYHRLGGLEKQEVILSWFRRPDV